MKKNYENLLVNIGANLVIVAVIAIILIGAFSGAVPASGKTKAIYSGNTAEKRVSLMVNVYWGTEYIDAMLNEFEKHNVKTTFFLGGIWVAKNADLVKKMVEQGHEIGNHGYFHKDHKALSEKQNEDEILVTQKLIESIAGVRTSLFAPPSGSLGNNMFTVCERHNYKVIMWGKDTIDWRDKDAEIVYKRATTDTQNGDLILMHPTAHTLKALPRILENLNQKGFKAVTVSENLAPTSK
ncbi:MAG: polysaccharide deacetylase family protein [Firmicutes bacterium]|nr:polysaccharide deacetylase family protein [Bacillota bacterium]